LIVHPDGVTQNNRDAWNVAAQKYVREYDETLALARTGTSLFPQETQLLGPLLTGAPLVVHPQSGWGLDDIALLRTGAGRVIGVDFSEVTAAAAQRRADELGFGDRCRYVVAALPGAPLPGGCADLVYTGKGALMWQPDLDRWAADLARLVRPGGHLFVFEGHPMMALWTHDTDEPRVRPDRSYFGRGFVNDDFPANGAVEYQFTLGSVINAVVAAGLEIRHVEEYPDPFWRYGDVDAAAYRGRLPNTFALIARR
jgi:SAM-dependent methyltransferase